ncbi:hypothetical protein [Athalassotoga saccharophila]|uniref:hypothetical protein n=1 Tax=Athalassotoga saccharophila TaxID=1441386 RepID=UPI001379ADA0|nr:hypothetical protein [Athalassotoga saccharophila]BBJ27202.1 hypothetical protein ATHSA_0070 [Athalassotoga saccharophila]
MMWQTITFFIVVNVISSFMTWSKTREMSLKVSKFNQILYTFFGGAFGILLFSFITKQKNYKPIFLTLIILENIGIYILLYELAIHVANR